MSSSSFAAPVAALDHPIMSKMMKELVATSDPLEGYALTPTTYTSVLSSDKYNDEHHRYWYVACQVAQTHFGVNLPDPLGSCDDASTTPAQATAAKEIHECYLEGLEDVMMRFYNLGFSRVSTATHRYALDFSLWMRGYALHVGCGDYGPQFSYTKPLDFVAPFSQEYHDFYRHRRAQEAPLNPIASTITTGSMPYDRPQEATTKPIASTVTTGRMPHDRPQDAPPKPIASTVTTGSMPHDRPQDAPPKPIASTITTGSMPHDRRVTVADFNELLREDRERAREEREQANPETYATEAYSTSTAKPSRDNKPNPTSANIDQPSRRETRPAPPATSATRAHSSLAAQPSRGGNKRTLDESDAMALAPPFKRPQPGLPQTAQRTLTSMGLLGRNEIHQYSQAKQHSQAPTIATQTRNQSHRPQSSAQAPRGHPKFTARFCGNILCGSRNHELADCLGPPSRQGDIDGCPLCNTQQHGLDCCTKLPNITRNSLFDTLVTRRANLPVIRTSISILSLASSMNKLAVLAETMPLTKGTAKGIYTQRQPWKHPHRPRLFRDPALPSDPVAFLEKLDQSWMSVIMGTLQDYGLPENIPRNLTVFGREWISQLVPYRKVFAQAGVYVDGRGHYPFVTAPEQRAYEKIHKERVKQELSSLQREQAASRRRRH